MFEYRFGPRRSRRAGDAARDRRDWSEAERNYRRYLNTMPRDAAIWTQLGHVVKEQGHLVEALIAYRQAAVLTPEDPDPWLHLAYVAQQTGHREDAVDGFARHYRLTGERESWGMLVHHGADSSLVPPVTDRSPATFILIDELVRFLMHSVTLTGMQRVQVGLIDSLLDTQPDYRFIVSVDASGAADVTFWTIPADRVRALIAYAASGVDMQRAELDRLIGDANQASRHVDFIAGDVVFLPGAFCVIADIGRTCAFLKAHGVLIGFYIYDLIPITHPEFCDLQLVQSFSYSFAEMVQFADFFATISVYVEHVLRRYLVDYDLRQIPISPLPLAHFLTVTDSSQASPGFLQKLDRSLAGKPFALYVSTIEGRKNHLYTVNAWQELIRQGVDMPDLIFVGRRGWRSAGLFDFLDATRDLNGRVHLMHDVSDGDLAYLYRECDFTVFTSFVEGWGLPVGESLVFGKPCVASNACSIPEVGGDLIDYVDPFNMRGGMEVIRRLATDHGYRAARTASIVDGFEPRSWSEVARGLVEVIDAARSAPSIAMQPFRLSPGRPLSFRAEALDVTDLRNLLEYPARALLSRQFHGQETFGIWMNGVSGVIDLPTTLGAGEVAEVAVELVAPAGGSGTRVALSPIDRDTNHRYAASIPLARFASFPFYSVIRVPVGQDGSARIAIDLFDEDPAAQADPSARRIAIVSIGYGRHEADGPITNMIGKVALAWSFDDAQPISAMKAVAT